MSNIPFENYDITNSKELFGREKLLDTLVRFINHRHENNNIVGCRRFGKTCLLKSLAHRINGLEDPKCFPIYIDAKAIPIERTRQDGKIGTPKVYRYLSSLVVEKMAKIGAINEELEVQGVKLQPVTSLFDYYQYLEAFPADQMIDIFKKVILYFAPQIKKTITFLIDEYEFLMMKGFSESTGFMAMRQLATTNIDGFRPFSVTVAGAVTWSHLCSQIGSKELNIIGNQIYYVKPLTREAFSQMWKYECSMIEEEEIKELALKEEENIFKHTGGVPFYAKDYGTHIIKYEEVPDVPLTDSVAEVVDTLNYVDKTALYKMIVDPSQINSAELKTLYNLGLVDKKTNEVVIGDLTSYIKNELHSSEGYKIPTSYTLVDEISVLIENINDTAFNKGYEYIYTPVNQTSGFERDMRKPCNTKEELERCIIAIWKTQFERTKADVSTNPNNLKLQNRALLPVEVKNTTFNNIVATLRNTLSCHTYDVYDGSGQMKREDALFALVGSKVPPSTPQEMTTIQLALLEMFKKELKEIQKIVRECEDA